MKAASFNVNSIRARLPIVLDWLKAESPHILCLQETKVIDEDFPLQPFLEMGYHAAFRGEKSYSGVAILSRAPLVNVRYGFDNGDYASRLIRASVGGIEIVNTYIPQGFHPLSKQFREKLDWLQRLYDCFNAAFTPASPVLWLGDFNVAPEPDDVYDPQKMTGQVGYHPDERAVLEMFLRWGFVDVFRVHQTGPGHFTFWDYRIKNGVKGNIGWRVDHIWATRALARKSVTAWIDKGPRLRERPSDHTPVVAEFKL